VFILWLPYGILVGLVIEKTLEYLYSRCAAFSTSPKIPPLSEVDMAQPHFRSNFRQGMPVNSVLLSGRKKLYNLFSPFGKTILTMFLIFSVGDFKIWKIMPKGRRFVPETLNRISSIID
jgi:hypothetical protein